MERDHFSLIEEPKNDLYRDIIDCAVGVCDVAILVVRPTISLDYLGRKVLMELEPYLGEKNMCSEWPGTKLLDHKAQVLEYNLNNECAQVFKKLTNSLYEWCQPRLPEDLSFLRADGVPWLVSIAHEKDAYFCLSDEEKTLLIETIPLLSSFIKKDD